ncbi:Long-chain-fatty-acid--CoA ligase 5 [Habropoda laboriosa]|uniref:Long-chain-fatty-acid--CoA ligase n=1 Tax=Habropoda laboriosa TaxID=597456 RepID=A0A0L7QNE4_9HYME|nr:Long-chain-fatty-acid--CoA ligase 5 [Habropoda laboriosa]
MQYPDRTPPLAILRFALGIPLCNSNKYTPDFTCANVCVLQGTDLIKVSRFYKDSKEGKFVSFIHEDTTTLYEGFRNGAKESNNGPCLGWRDGPNKPYQWLHYNEALLRAKNFGSGLVTLGVAPGSHTLVGLYSQNCPEWILTEQACYTYSLIVVPLYDTLGPDACAFIINQAEINLVVCENDQKCNLLLDKAPRCLRKMVVIKEIKQTTIQRAKNRGVELLRFEDVERLGAQKNQPEYPPKVTDLCTICYTSGTTGNPKGVMLTHQNVMAGICAVLMQLGEHRPSYKDTMISFLPLAHMLERCCENGMYMVGGSVGFYSGDIKRLPEDMKALRPTVMPAVPRLLNRMYDKVQAELQSSCMKRMVFSLGMRAKEAEIKKGIIRNNSIWDKLAFGKIKESTGGRVRLMVVGSAPLAGNVLTFARCALGCLVVEGYGQTECCAPITLTVQFIKMFRPWESPSVKSVNDESVEQTHEESALEENILENSEISVRGRKRLAEDVEDMYLKVCRNLMKVDGIGKEEAIEKSAKLLEIPSTTMRELLNCGMVQTKKRTKSEPNFSLMSKNVSCTILEKGKSLGIFLLGDHVPEHVGPPVPCCCVKLVDVPEMEYYARKNQGEVCVKGTNVFVGYFKDPERTAQVIDEFGWHHTGDVGMWLPNGALKIIDRRKHTFKLSQGEYIVPEKIENIYLRSQYVHQVFVHGESLKSCVVGIAIPDVDVVKCWAVENGIPGTLSVLCANPQVKQLIMDDMLAWGKEAGLKSFEQVKDIYLHPDPFSVQNGLLTPQLKMKRPQLKEYFKPQIEDLYRHLD